ncbi:MAG TPA: phospholipase D-like domain-containing protein, partial [Draconibacterium sp.]|nr:phospholipase D-like domain-containing protein [Draconibacterium sp.]
TNLTNDQIYIDANNMIFIQDQTLAKTYQIEFEEMWGSSADQPDAATAKFGAEKSDNTPHHFIIGDIPVECYFSPSDNTNQKIINAINTANNDLNVETMLITRTDLANAIGDAKQRGVNVRVITNYQGDNSDAVNNILNDILPVGKFVFDNSANGILHNKLAIIDASSAESDPQVITGSHNWSTSANDINDENTLIIHNAELANLYYQQFAYRFVENGGSLVVSAENIEINEVKVYPNPTIGEVKITAPTTISKVELFTLSGKMIQQNNDINSNQVKLQMQNKIAGVYLLKVQLQNGNLNTYKIVKR